MSHIKSVCVYCGASSEVADVYKQAAHHLGQVFAKEGVRLVYGGGGVGLMGIVADACYEKGGEVIGIIPKGIIDKEIKNNEVTELFVVDNMHTRKRMMMERSDAFAVLPGGMGTLDETFEILTWKYLGFHDKPVVFVNVNNYFEPLFKMIDHMVNEKFTHFWHRSLYQVVDSPLQVLPALNSTIEHIRPDVSQL